MTPTPAENHDHPASPAPTSFAPRDQRSEQGAEGRVSREQVSRAVPEALVPRKQAYARGSEGRVSREQVFARGSEGPVSREQVSGRGSEGHVSPEQACGRGSEGGVVSPGGSEGRVSRELASRGGSEGRVSRKLASRGGSEGPVSREQVSARGSEEHVSPKQVAGRGSEGGVVSPGGSEGRVSRELASRGGSEGRVSRELASRDGSEGRVSRELASRGGSEGPVSRKRAPGRGSDGPVSRKQGAAPSPERPIDQEQGDALSPVSWKHGDREDGRRDAVVQEAAHLIAIEGHQDHPDEERAVADHVARRLRHNGVDVELQPVGDTGRVNVIARVRGVRPGPTLMFNAHLDTVPPYGMSLTPTIHDGRLTGRGAADMKGALAAMLAVVDRFAADRDFAGELMFTGVAGEENGSPGMQALVAAGTKADFAIVGEPTMMRVGRAHKGAMWARATFRGVATHGSVPWNGINAIQHAARFVTALETGLAPVLHRRTHPLLGPATINVGVITGGDRPPMVPASCVVGMDRRWLPGEDHAAVLAEIRAVAEAQRIADPRVDVTVDEMDGTGTFVHAPLDCPPDDPHLRMLLDVAGGAPVGLQFWTDGALLAAHGTPAVVCGPGDIAQAHSLDEWVAVDQLHRAAEVYFAFAARMLSLRSASTEMPR